MRRTATFLLVMLALAYSQAPAQSLEFEKYELANGMTVILHQDDSLPVVSLNLWYYVGSKDEAPGRSGFAHMFEHLMFMGSERVGEGEFDTIMEGGGGWNNATTSKDRTSYYDVGPANLLPTLLWLEADRLEALGEAMNQDKLDRQRDIVRNERRQSYENRPYGMAYLRIPEMMYPEGHPYRISTIGSHEDLVAATVDDVKEFFDTYYVPSNLSLVVAGNFDPGEIKPLVEKLFGSLPRGSQPLRRSTPSVQLDEVKRTTMSDQVQFAKLGISYHSPPNYSPGDAEMDLIADILASGVSSRLYQKLIYEEPLATGVEAYQQSQMLGSLFHIEATAKPGVPLAKLEAAVDEVLAEFVANGPTVEELERYKASWEYAYVSQLQSLTRKADMLNRYQFYFGDPGSLERDLARYRNATVESVREWAKKTLTPEARLVLHVLPEIEAPEENPRDAQPALGDEREFQPPLPVTFELSNGLTVHHWERGDLPLVNMELMFFGGAAMNPEGEMGLASMTAAMLAEGSGELGAVEFANAMEDLGASFNAGSGRETTSVTLSSLTRTFDAALALFAGAVTEPAFDPKEWDRVRSLRVDDLKSDQDNPSAVASLVGMRSFFGNGHPYGRPSSGTPESVEDLTVKQVSKFHRTLYRPENAVLLIAGDLTEKDAKKRLEAALGDWKRGGKPLKRASYPQRKDEPFRVVLVDKPDAVQTVIRWYMPGRTFTSPERVDLQMFNTILGGSFTSRLNYNLREDKGYTYGAGSQFSFGRAVGYALAYANVRADVTGESISEFLKEYEGIRAGNITPEEAAKAAAGQRSDTAQSFASLRGILSSYDSIIINDLPFTTLANDLARTRKVTAETLNTLAHDAIPLEKSLLVPVGDKDLILEEIKDLDLPTPIELTPTGDPK